MKLLPPSALPLAVALAPVLGSCATYEAEQEDFLPAFQAEEVVRVRYERTLDMDLVGLKDRLTVDGVPEAEPDPLVAKGRIQTRVRVGFQDRYSAIEKGRPTVIRRRYDELWFRQESWLSFGGQEAEVQEAVGTSPLAGRELRLLWNDVTQGYQASYVAGGGEPPADVRPDVWLPELLPDRDVESGDVWTVDAAALRSVLPPGGYPAWRIERSVEGAEYPALTPQERDLNRQLTEDLRGTVRCKYAGRKQRSDGSALEIIKLRAEITTSGIDHTGVEGETDEVAGSSDVVADYVLEGELAWDRLRRRVVHVHLAGPVGVRMRSVHGFEESGERIELREWRLYEGRMSVTVEVR